MKLFESTYNDGFTYYERYFDTTTNTSAVQEIKTKSEYYVPSSTGSFTYLLDESIKLQKQYGNSKDKGTVYGKIRPDQAHIRDNYWKAEGSQYNMTPRTWYIDIETTAYGAIDVDAVREEVVLIQIYDNVNNEMIILGSRDWTGQANYNYDFPVKYYNCKNEVNIYKAFFIMIKELKPLMVLGWNTEGFDYPYLFNRAKKLGLDTNQFSPFNKSTLIDRSLENGFRVYKLQADGVMYLDYLEIYKKYVFIPRTSYSLDNISKVELGENKVNHDMYSTFDGFRTGDNYIFPTEVPTDDFDLKMYNLQCQYRDNPTPELKEQIHDLANDLFVHYGCIDTYLVKRLDDKLRLSNILITIASKMGVNINDSLGTVKPWGAYINNIAYQERKILPSIDVDPNADTSIKGGYVADPDKGKHEWVVSVDINSAYPNLSMRGFNMSAETFVPRYQLPDEMRDLNLKYFSDEDEEARFDLYINNTAIFNRYTQLAKDNNMSLGINGAVFSKNSLGIIPRLVKAIYAERKAKKKEMLDWKQKAEHLSNEMKRRKL